LFGLRSRRLSHYSGIFLRSKKKIFFFLRGRKIKANELAFAGCFWRIERRKSSNGGTFSFNQQSLISDIQNAVPLYGLIVPKPSRCVKQLFMRIA